MFKKFLVLTALLTLFVSAAIAQDAPAVSYEPMDGCFTPIMVELEYECGYVTVPAFYDGRTDSTLRLAVVRIFATGEEAKNPVFFMDGGPGGSLLINLGLDQISLVVELGMADDPAAVTPLLDMLETRDFVVFSQRGTQFSEPMLICEEAEAIGKAAAIEGLDPEVASERSLNALRACVDAYTADGTDFNAFNNFANADDVNAVRQALGYDQIVFYGESYGAQLGQHVMQRHPGILEAVILDGVNALAKVEWTQDSGLVLEQGIRQMLATCAADAACAAHFPNPETLLDDAFARVQEAPITAVYTATDGSSFDVVVKPELLAEVMETMFVDAQQRGGIPLALAALRDGDASWIAAAVGDEVTKPAEVVPIAGLMHMAMVCSDDPPQSEPTYDQTDYSEFAALTEQVFAASYADQCAVLNVERLPDESDVDVSLDVPVLVLSGGLDVRTPPFRNQQVADALPNSRVITFDLGDHVQYRGDFAPCAASLVSQFVIDPSTLQNLDASCTASLFPTEFTYPPLTVQNVIDLTLQASAVSIASTGESKTPPEGSTYSVTFSADGQMTIVADCNTVTASGPPPVK
jgi:pimeloyl-ACP methyl ester carboxylesterase